KGCTKGLFHQSQHSISVFCTNMMERNQKAEATGYAHPTQDLFMENVMFCGMAGFSDFYKAQWLETTVSWQRPQESGFGKPAPKDEELVAARPHPQHILRRVRSREKLFADGCSCHNTATTVAALVGFLYFLAENPPANREQPPSTLSPQSDY
uniref:UPF0764 protein C16orf89 homolog n=1 Tax=Castor canadensis TaxID=51338 RepID=A0A8B7TNA6_CASCN